MQNVGFEFGAKQRIGVMDGDNGGDERDELTWVG